MSERKIFRTLISLEEAIARLLESFNPKPVGEETVSVEKSLGRVLSDDVISGIDVPSFDRAAMDGYAIIAEDTFGAEEDHPIVLDVVGRVEAGEKLDVEVISGKAVEIATGAPMPKGANSVVMVEYTHEKGGSIEVRRAVTPGENVMAAGSDIMAGELVLRKSERITSREMGVIAALGVEAVKVYRKPKVAVISTGNEVLKLGEQPQYGKIFDINANSLVGAVIESGCEPFYFGIARDDSDDMVEKIGKALKSSEVVITSGSTSAGVGDKLYRILNDFGRPGVIVHGLSVKPGKPAVVAVVKDIPVFALPGYPTSAMIVFQILVKPILLRMTGLNETQTGNMVEAVLALKVFSAAGRREFMPVHIIVGESGKYVAYPVTGGSGAITSYAMADGFIDIPIDRKLLDEGETVTVTLLSPELRPADLTIIGSHCIGIDILLGVIRRTHPGFSAKIVNVGSMGGLNAVVRGEADLAGIHLIDETSGEFNISYVKRPGIIEKVTLFRGYNREQGLVIAKGNPKSITGFEDFSRKDVTFINRNPGSGTRIIIDLNLRKIAEKKSQQFKDVTRSIKGYTVEAKSHSAVATAIIQGKADVGVAIRAVTKDQPLDFIPITDEQYDFLARKSWLQKESVRLFLDALKSWEFKEELERRAIGINVVQETGDLILNSK
jgi:putative molybdopterin biosynthesis protein